MAPPVKGWQVSKNRCRSSLLWSGLETHRREQRADASATEEEAQVQPWWLRINHGHSIGSSIAGSSETGSMEEDGGSGSGSGSREPFVAGAGAGTGAGNSNGGAGAGTSAKLPQVLQKSFGEVQGILEQNRVLIQEISQNQETRDADGLTRNVALIRELNTNIARVVDLYGDMSGSFARAVAAKKAAGGDKGGPKRPRSAGAGSQQQQ
ncbi:uncharacterized protein LOC8056220 [Sorghum bicolor]|uniref:Protein EARLY FLOWERING 4 domain-containing protein n=1 Tax=Sorghum bicolor TaxID=4558 RepID=A0A1B6QCC4_SORBI|nr:uncharacterized protein LOC8056220 [Sorghum bicolor]KXG35568.1 hypothetical protein SORBI_3002G193000 [Sorghum bicolor]|eukprot:XP_002460178.2 uncharacterized protein LOC8056220 [Sorghum bicolor]